MQSGADLNGGSMLVASVVSELHKAALKELMRSRYYLICGKKARIKLRNKIDGYIETIEANCKSWRCPACASLKGHKLKKRFANAGSQYFVTLTLSPKKVGNRLEIDERGFQDKLNIFLTRVRRDYKNVQYIRAIQRHKNGAIHCHILFNIYVPARDYWQWGNVDIQRINNIQKSLTYLLSYITSGSSGFKPYTRIVSWSRMLGRMFPNMRSQAYIEFYSTNFDGLGMWFDSRESIFELQSREYIPNYIDIENEISYHERERFHTAALSNLVLRGVY